MIDIDISESEISAFCRRNRIRRLSLFGSVIRDDFRPDSDVDVLVEFEPDEARVGLFDLSRLERELTGIVGRRVDMNTANALRASLRDDVLVEAKTLYPPDLDAS